MCLLADEEEFVSIYYPGTLGQGEEWLSLLSQTTCTLQQQVQVTISWMQWIRSKRTGQRPVKCARTVGFPVLLRITLISQHEAAFPFSFIFVWGFFKGTNWPRCIRLLFKDRNWNWSFITHVLVHHHIFNLVHAGPLQQDDQPAFINARSASRTTKINDSANVSCELNDSL